MGIANLFNKTIVGKALGLNSLFDQKSSSQPDPADALRAEETKKKKARQVALQSLNPTGTTGAGTPQTTRRTTLGV